MLRQKLDTYHWFNGAVYIRRIVYTETRVQLLEDDEYAFIMECCKSIDIDTELDFLLAECLKNAIN